MRMLDILTIIGCLYVIAESLEPTVNMGAGLKGFCHKAKYAMFSFCSVVVIHDVWLGCNKTSYMLIVMSLVLAVWPRMLWRLRLFGLLPKKG